MKKKILANVFIWIFFILAVSFASLEIYKKHNNNIYYMDADYIADFSDNKKVAWVADNIFIWEVKEELWWMEKKEGEWKIPNTLFTIKVLYNIKWKLEGNINILQEWWYDEYWNLFLMEWNKLLEKWNIYLFTSKWKSFTINSHKNWHHFLFSNKNLKEEEIMKFIQEDQTVKDFREAYKNEEYYQDNYKISSEINAYKNLTSKEKEDFEIFENWFNK